MVLRPLAIVMPPKGSKKYDFGAGRTGSPAP